MTHTPATIQQIRDGQKITCEWNKTARAYRNNLISKKQFMKARKTLFATITKAEG